MKDCIWKFITLFTSVSIAFAIDGSIWMPTCSQSSSENTLIPHPADCRKFFICIDGIAYPLSCPYGLSWNPSLNKCSSLPSCKNEHVNRIPKYNPLCPIDENPENPTHLPDNNDCGKFYECQGGFAFHMICPDRKHWSVEHDSCEYAAVAKCYDSRQAIGNGQLNAACPIIDDPDNPIHLPHPEDCSKFLKCSFGRSYIISCPYSLHWYIDGDRCESPAVAQCEQIKFTTAQPPITPAPASTNKTSPSQPSSSAKSSSNVKPSFTAQQSSTTNPSFITKPSAAHQKCPSNGVKNFGIPGQCDKYFSCSQGKLYIIACRKGRKWSETLSKCVDSTLAEYSSLNNGQNILPTTKKSALKRPIFSSNTQRPQVKTRPTSCTPGVGFLSHPTDCHKFLVCDNGKPVEMICPNGLLFSHVTSSCQWTNIDC